MIPIELTMTLNNFQTTCRVDVICKGLKENVFNDQNIDPILEKFMLNDKLASITLYFQTGLGKLYTIAKCMPFIFDRVIALFQDDKNYCLINQCC
jgi:hypothetical protein